MVPDDNKALVKGCLQTIGSSEKLIKSLVPKHFDGDKLLRLTVAALNDSERLPVCVPITIVNAVVTAAKLGLEFNTPLGHGYLVPYYSSKLKKYCCQFIPGYRGLIHLAIQSGKVDSVYSDLVYDKDCLDFTQGPNGTFVHKPELKAERGDWYMGYCMIRHTSGLYSPITYMRRDAIMAIKERTNSKNREGKIVGPWKTDEVEMSRKTVAKRGLKYEPLSVEIQHAVGIEDLAEAGKDQPRVVSVDMFEPESREILAGDDLPELEAGSEDALSDTEHEQVMHALELTLDGADLKQDTERRRKVLESVYGVRLLETVRKRPTEEIAKGLEEIRTWVASQRGQQPSLLS